MFNPNNNTETIAGPNPVWQTLFLCPALQQNQFKHETIESHVWTCTKELYITGINTSWSHLKERQILYWHSSFIEGSLLHSTCHILKNCFFNARVPKLFMTWLRQVKPTLGPTKIFIWRNMWKNTQRFLLRKSGSYCPCLNKTLL